MTDLTTPKAVTARRASPTLAIALWSVIGATALVLVVARLRAGPEGWLLGLGRVGVLILLALLVLRGRSWARWVLVVWLGLATLAFFANTVRAVGQPVLLAVFLAMAGLHIWAVVELAKADLAGPSETTV